MAKQTTKKKAATPPKKKRSLGLSNKIRYC